MARRDRRHAGVPEGTGQMKKHLLLLVQALSTCVLDKGRNMKTRTFLLAGVAALSMLASAAHAAEEYCVEVKKTPDGFLAVREKPTVKSKIFATLRPKFPLTVNPEHQFLEDNEYRLYKNWTKWTHVKGWFSTEDADPSWGWVYSKYIRKVPCTPAEEETR